MNAVNLIPAERRAAAVGAPSRPFMGLLAGLLVVLVATVVYVGARDDVSAKRSELSSVQAAAAEWSAAAARYAPAVSATAQRKKQFAQLDQLIDQRYGWSELLSQVAGVMPAHAALTALTATSGAQAGAAADAGTTAGATGGSGIQISGCAVSQSVVADAMVALRRLSGVSEVSLSSSTSGSAAASSTSGTSGGGGSCTLPIQFQLSLMFAPPASAADISDGVASPSSQTTTAALSSDTTGAAR